MLSRRLTDRISELCQDALLAPEGPELTKILAQLRDTIEELTGRLRWRAVNPLSERRRDNQFHVERALCTLPEAIIKSRAIQS